MNGRTREISLNRKHHIKSISEGYLIKQIMRYNPKKEENKLTEMEEWKMEERDGRMEDGRTRWQNGRS